MYKLHPNKAFFFGYAVCFNIHDFITFISQLGSQCLAQCLVDRTEYDTGWVNGWGWVDGWVSIIVIFSCGLISKLRSITREHFIALSGHWFHL